MAVGFEVESRGDHDYNGRITPYVALSCMMAGMGGVIFGYDIGISGGVTSMAPFLKKFFPDVYRKMKHDSHISNYCKFNSHLLTSFTSSLYIAGLITTLFASRLSRMFGRRTLILAGGAAFLVGSAIGAAAINVYMLILGRVLLGVGVGFANQSVPLYLSEMAPPKYRGAFSNGFQFSIAIGALVANLINYGTQKIKADYGWRISLALAAVPGGILTLGAIFLPDTPNSIIHRGGDPATARKILQRVRGTDNVDDELKDLIEAAKAKPTSKSNTILERKYRPQLTMAVAIPFFQQVTGINVIAFYSPLVFRTIGLGESAALLATILTGSVVGASFTFISMITVDKLGRRLLFITGGVIMLATQLLVGAILAAELGDRGGVGKTWAVLILIFVSIYVAGFGWSWGPLGWLVPSEIFQLEIRSVGQSVTVAVSFLFTFLVAQLFLEMLCRMKSGLFFFFGGWMGVMTVFLYVLLPETKGVPMEQMEKVWREHWFWKRYVGGDDKESI